MQFVCFVVALVAFDFFAPRVIFPVRVRWGKHKEEVIAELVNAIKEHYLEGCVVAPLVEELKYRFVPIGAAAVILGVNSPWVWLVVTGQAVCFMCMPFHLRHGIIPAMVEFIPGGFFAGGIFLSTLQIFPEWWGLLVGYFLVSGLHMFANSRGIYRYLKECG